jgi:F0F1-type ATP synthase assembly protein I
MEAVLAVPVAMGLGYWADSRFGTEPICMLVGVVFGFATFVVRLVRMRHEIDGQGEDE